LPTALIALPGTHHSARLRAHDPPVIARIEHGTTILDLRTVDPGDDQTLIDAIRD